MNQQLIKINDSKVIFWVAGFFLLFYTLFFTSSSVSAKEITDAEIAAFYHQISSAEKSSIRQQKKLTSPKIKKSYRKKLSPKLKNTSKPKKVAVLKSTGDLNRNDPALIAFYESLDIKKLIPEVQKKSAPKEKNTVIVARKVTKENAAVIDNRDTSYDKTINNQADNLYVDIDNKGKVTPPLLANKIIKTPARVEVLSSSREEVPEADVKSSVTLSQTTNNTALSNQGVSDEKAEQPSPNNSKASDLNALFAKAFGKKVASTPKEVTAELRVNKSTVGELKLFSNTQGVLDKVETEPLLISLKDVLKEHVYVRVDEKLKSQKKIHFSELSKMGIDAEYNPTNLSLDLNIKNEFRKPNILSMINRKKASVRAENKIKANDISTFINAYTTVGLNSQNTSEADFKMKLEGSLNIGDRVLETTLDIRDEEYVFSNTTLTFDQPEKLKRYTLGNISSGNRNFQENLSLNGIRVSKEFFMDPELQIRPQANESLVLDSDSEVEVFINNQLIRRFYLKEGVYSLEDIGLYNGANNIRVRIKDEFGKITVKSSEQFYDSHLLKSGLSLYAFSVGYLSNEEGYTNDSLEDELILSGYYQKGLTKDLTLSVDAQITPNSYLLGTEVLTSVALGSIKNSFAVSGGADNQDTGYATSFEFRPNKKREYISLDTLREDMLGLEPPINDFLNGWTITGEYRSENFSQINEVQLDTVDELGNIVEVSNQRLKSNFQTNFSLNLSEKWNGYLNLGISDYYDADENIYASLNTTRRFDNGVSLSLGARYDSEDDFSMSMQLSVPLSHKSSRRKKSLDVLVNTKDSTLESKLSVKPTSLVGTNSLAGSLEHYQDDDTRQQNLNVQYRHNRFESTFAAHNRYSMSDSENTQQLNVGFNTSLACVGGNCATSYPINDSFALVTGPSNQEAPIAINNGNNRFRYSEDNDTGLPDNYTALIPGKGDSAVVRLDSYRYQNINIDESTLPNGYDTEKTEFEVLPKYHQGFLIKAGGEPQTILDGMLVNTANKPLGFKGGQWVPVSNNNAKEENTIAFFSNKAGRFRVISIPAGTYKLELFDYPDMDSIQITVPDLKGEVHKVGNLIIGE
ncbi:fimbria/pilus outer membrane usher protein [uncultured Cocleimonas sp.]|uniref:fimbria/pilus outer membrane usher protein n=1 Tax=uncultured Cocleimonas sp. TaxID=1051587 RepID=UPI0026198D05|nr:fimbria/pilus outer membrane usher protein [uncultured Cocleimonas sp.]